MATLTSPAGGEALPRSSSASVPRSRHIEMLVIATITILASLLLNVGLEDRVHVAGLPDIPLPKMCLSREIFGMDCPGCGLTRSFVHLAHFDWQSAWSIHRLGWLLFFATLIQLPYRIQALLSKKGSIVPLALSKAFGNFLITMLILNWLGGVLFVSAVAGN